MKYEITPERKAQIYAMIAWNGKTYEEAEKLVQEKSFDEVDKEVYSISSIDAAKQGIDEKKEELKTDKKYDAIIKIIEGIHNNWVSGNAKKYDRGNEEKSKKQIFQHLPTALIGIDEVAKDLMFLEPFLKELGINAGEMEHTAYGSFKPSNEIITAYNNYVKNFKEKLNIETFEDLEDSLEEIIKKYKPLHANDEISKKRIAYMKNNIEVLATKVQEKNITSFKNDELNV